MIIGYGQYQMVSLCHECENRFRVALRKWQDNVNEDNVNWFNKLFNWTAPLENDFDNHPPMIGIRGGFGELVITIFIGKCLNWKGEPLKVSRLNCWEDKLPLTFRWTRKSNAWIMESNNFTRLIEDIIQ